MSNEPLYTLDDMEAAVCLWEVTLEWLNNDNLQDECVAKLDSYRYRHGTASLRLAIMNLAKQCEADYQVAAAAGYDDAFDWDFTPAWLDKYLKNGGVL